MTDEGLFDIHPNQIREPEPVEQLSADRRRTVRQREALRHGQHPLGLAAGVHLRLHPDAPTADDTDAPGPRCGGCRFRDRVTSNGNRYFPKCLRGWDPGTYLDRAPYASHSASSDCRAWWPACEHWEAKP